VAGDGERALRRFAADVVHELNNLLTGVLGLGDRAAMQPPEDAELRRHLAHVVEQAGRLKRLAAELGEFSREGRLPPPRAGENTAAERRDSAGPRGRVRASAPGTVVVLVEDEVVVREIVAAQLEALGHRVLAFDSAEALEAARLDPGAFDAAVIDLALPGRDGHSLAATLRRANPGLAVILLSGSPPAAEYHGADAWLTKPVPLQELQRALAAALAPRG
jgi:CheY-like chemotaxis protein